MDGKQENAEYYAFVQCVECTRPVHEVEEILCCSWLQWSKGDEVAHTASGKFFSGRAKLEICAWNALELFTTFGGFEHVLRANYVVVLLTAGLLGARNRF